jgi:hypothetical protein
VAAPGGKSQAPESFTDSLGDVYMAICNAKLSQDADLGFLNKLEMVVMGRLKTPPAQPGGAQPPGASGPPGGGAPQGPPPGGPPPGGQAVPQGGPNPHAAIPPPDMDDVRDTIAQTTGP